MKLLARMVLLAYPRSFRQDYGAEWTRTVNDLRVHRGLGTARIFARVLVDAFATAPRMRWENLVGPTKTILQIVAVIAGVLGLLIGSPAVAPTRCCPWGDRGDPIHPP